MYIATIPNRRSPPAILLREGYREQGKVKNRTLANLSQWPKDKVETLRHVLRGEKLAPAGDHFEIIRSYHHGHVDAVRRAMKSLAVEPLIASARSRKRDLVMGMVAARILDPGSKLATTRWWHTTTLPRELGIENADEDDLYGAMDWLLQRQLPIEKKLAARHLKEGCLVLFDLTSSYFEGVTCPLAALGHNRDGKKGRLQVNWGLLTDGRGRPVAVSVFKGNTGDPTTLMPQVRKVKEQFGIETMALVGDRGMITQTRIDEIKELDGVDWITALKAEAIGKLMEDRTLQMKSFAKRNWFEMTHPDYPGERLVGCLNSELRALRARTRRSLIEATTRELDKVRAMVRRGRLLGRDEIGVRVGREINHYKVAKHFVLDIQDDRFDFHVDEKKVEAEAALDGIYVIRTSLKEDQSSAEDTVRRYKKLALVEQAFRALKTIDIKTRPIRHHTEDRVRSHIFLCMLAYYVEWHMREAWRPLLFCDEDQQAKETRDPVAPAKRSEAALENIHSKVLNDGTEVHSFQTLLKLLSAIVLNVCRVPRLGRDAPTFEIATTPNDKQRRAYGLLEEVPQVLTVR